MNLKIFEVFTFCCLGLSVFRCGKYSASPVGADVFQGQNPDMERRVTFYAAPSDTSYRIPVVCGASPYLFVGDDRGLESWTYIVFDTATTSGSLVKATLSFTVLPYPESDASPVEISILPTESPWDEGTMTWDTKISPASETPLFREQASLSEDTTRIDLDVPLELAAALVSKDTSVERTGLLIRAEGTGGFIRLFSREFSTSSPLIPHLTLITESDTMTVMPRKDTFVSNSARTVPPDRLWIQDGTADRILMRFNVSGIPPEATVNRARLVLHTDAESAFPAPTSAFYLSAVPLADSVWTLPGVATDSTWIASGAASGDSIATILTSWVQKWTSGTAPNCGLMLKGTLENTDLAGRSVFSSSADSVRIPRLEIFYSIPPTGRY